MFKHTFLPSFSVSALWLASLCLSCGIAARAQASEVTVQGNNAKISRTCQGDNVTVSGNNNLIILHGECKTLTVAGNNNSVKVDAARSISTPGNNNAVGWRRRKPEVSNLGNGNLIYRLK